MIKVIEMNTPFGIYHLPLKLVAEHRADYYAVEKWGNTKDSEEYKEQVDYVMNDSYEGIDWLLNNSDYEDWESETIKVTSEIKVLKDDFWTNSEDFKIVLAPWTCN